MLRDGDGAQVAHWEHAGPGEPVRIVHRDADARTYLRDAANRLVARTEGDGTELRYGFDVLGRVVSVDAARPGGGAAARVRTLTYDADPDPGHPSAGRFLAGRVAVVEEAGNTFRWSYDRGGRPVREEQLIAGATAAVEREYDLQGHPRVVTYPDGTRVEYVLDPSGAVIRVIGLADDFEYDADGHLLGYVADNGMRVELPREPGTRRLAAVRATAPGGALLRGVEYGYDEVGCITSLLDTGPGGTESSRFDYDGLFRLVGATVRAGGPGGPWCAATRTATTRPGICGTTATPSPWTSGTATPRTPAG